jgi:predicted transcriptional regulator
MLASMSANPSDPDPDLEAWQLQHIRQGLAELEAGLFIPHEEVRRWLANLRRSAPLSRPLLPD